MDKINKIDKLLNEFIKKKREKTQINKIRNDKNTMGHLHNEILLGCKKEENFTLWTVWTDLENIILSDRNQSEKDKYHVISLV